MMIGDLSRLPESIGEHDANQLRKFQAFLRTRRNLREATARHGLDSPQASDLRLDLIRQIREASDPAEGDAGEVDR